MRPQIFVMLSVLMLNVIKQSIVMLSVVAPCLCMPSKASKGCQKI